MYNYTCPRCDTSFEFHARITQRKRYCAHCGERVRVEEIDRQKTAQNEQQARVLGLGIVLVLVAIVLFIVLLFKSRVAKEKPKVSATTSQSRWLAAQSLFAVETRYLPG